MDMKRIHNIIAICAFACATTGFAQEADIAQQEAMPQETSEQETFQQDQQDQQYTQDQTQQQEFIQQAPQQNPQQIPQQNPQQPVYYAVPKPTGNVQYVVMPQQNPPPQQVYMVNPQPQQTYAVPPVQQRQSSLSLFMGLGVNFYISTLTYEEDNDYSYDSDYEAQHDFDGKGFNIEGDLGILIKDFIGIRGFFGIGEQSGESKYWNSNVRCDRDSCSDVETDVVHIFLGISATLFPFNKSDNPMYNAYVEGAFGLSIQTFDDEVAELFDREGSATMFLKLEVGKLFRISETWNVGVGVAYSLDITAETYHDSYEDTYYSDVKHSFWAGVRFVRKKNSF